MSTSVEALAQPAGEWPIHSMLRPQPVVVRPGPSAPAAGPPSDAVVLFDGSSLEHWRSAGDTGTPAGWTVRDGYMEVAPGTGNIVSRQAFGDVQLHLAWATPAPAHGDGQARGNSGVFLTILYNGVLVQDDVVLTGPTAHQHRPPYATHPDRLPLELQDHGNLVRYRNIWIREL